MTANKSYVSVSTSQVQFQNEWTGKDYVSSIIPGLDIFGSYLHSDSDKGTIVLKLNRGDRLLYRSGPTAGRQLVHVIGRSDLKSILPVAQELILLEFSNSNLPDEFIVRFEDRGDGWGEWSAIGLRIQ